jgi:hypothetical protein
VSALGRILVLTSAGLLVGGILEDSLALQLMAPVACLPGALLADLGDGPRRATAGMWIWWR